MPATEQTWRSMPVMHRVFAVACVAMFLATLWMFYDDHFNRGWKSYQMTARQIDVTMNQLRKEQFETDAKLRAGAQAIHVVRKACPDSRRRRFLSRQSDRFHRLLP